jgi:hypothetical protein
MLSQEPPCTTGCAVTQTSQMPTHCNGGESEFVLIYFMRVGLGNDPVKIQACFYENGTATACLRNEVGDEDVWLQPGQQSRVVRLNAPPGSDPDQIKIFQCIGNASVQVMYAGCSTCSEQPQGVCQPTHCGGTPSFGTFYGGCTNEGSCNGPEVKRHDAEVLLTTLDQCARIVCWWDVREGCTLYSTAPWEVDVPGSPDGWQLGYKVLCQQAGVHYPYDQVLRFRYVAITGNIGLDSAEGCCTYQPNMGWTCTRTHGGLWYNPLLCGQEGGIDCPH